jgi:hypothetical protein
MKRVIVLVALSLLVADRVPVAIADAAYPLVGASGVYTLLESVDERKMPIPKHLDEIFGKKCDATLRGLSEVDRQGIRAGTEHATPSLDSDLWTYWKNRFGKMTVSFANGKVVGLSR